MSLVGMLVRGSRICSEHLKCISPCSTPSISFSGFSSLVTAFFVKPFITHSRTLISWSLWQTFCFLLRLLTDLLRIAFTRARITIVRLVFLSVCHYFWLLSLSWTFYLKTMVYAWLSNSSLVTFRSADLLQWSIPHSTDNPFWANNAVVIFSGARRITSPVSKC